MMNNPDDPLEMIVFMTTLFGSNISYATKLEQAFINREQMRMIRVPPTRKLIFICENYRVMFSLYISKISAI